MTSVCMAVYFRVLHFGCIFFLFRELFLNACVDNQKRDFWGPYLWPLDLFQYSFPITYENCAAPSMSQRVTLSNLQRQGPLHHLRIRHKSFHARVWVWGWWRISEADGYRCIEHDRQLKTGAGSEIQRGWEEGRDRPWSQSPTSRMIVRVGATTIVRDVVLPLSCRFSTDVNVSLCSLCNDWRRPFSCLPFPYWHRHCRCSRSRSHSRSQNHSGNRYGGAVFAVLQPSTASGLESSKQTGSDMPPKATVLKSWVSNGSSTDGGMGRSNGSVKFPLPLPMTLVQRSRGGRVRETPPPSSVHQPPIREREQRMRSWHQQRGGEEEAQPHSQ